VPQIIANTKCYNFDRMRMIAKVCITLQKYGRVLKLSIGTAWVNLVVPLYTLACDWESERDIFFFIGPLSRN
jgi:hypothetical protein